MGFFEEMNFWFEMRFLIIGKESLGIGGFGISI